MLICLCGIEVESLTWLMEVHADECPCRQACSFCGTKSWGYTVHDDDTIECQDCIETH